MHQPRRPVLSGPGLRPGAGPFPMNPALAVTRAAALRWWQAGYEAGRRPPSTSTRP